MQIRQLVFYFSSNTECFLLRKNIAYTFLDIFLLVNILLRQSYLNEKKNNWGLDWWSKARTLYQVSTVRHHHILKRCLNCALIQIRSSWHKKLKFLVLLFCCWSHLTKCSFVYWWNIFRKILYLLDNENYFNQEFFKYSLVLYLDVVS